MSRDDDPLDLSAWSAPTPPRGLAGRVMNAVRAGAAEGAAVELDTRPRDTRRDQVRRRAGILGGLALGLAAAGAVWTLWPSPPRSTPTSGRVVAAAPSKIVLGPGTTALLTAGADVLWQREGNTLAVTHAAGAVTYEHTGASRLVITTPGATVSTARATLHLEVPVNKHIVSGAAGAAAAAAIVIAVYEGRAEVREPAAAPRVVESGAQVAIGPAPSAAPAPQFQPVARATRDRARRDELAAAIAGARARTASAAVPLPAGGGGGPGGAIVGAPPPAPAPAVDPTPGQLSKDEIRAGVKEVVPMLAECYEALLELDPQLRTTVTAKLVVDSEPDLGSIVSLSDDLEFSIVMKQRVAAAPLREFNDCMTATLESVVLPPLGDKDGGRVEISYPFVFTPAPGDVPAPDPAAAQKPTPRPKPQPAATATTPEGMLALAEEAAKRSQWARALQHAEDAMGAGPNGQTKARAAMVAALAACNTRNPAKARRYFQLATPTSRTLIEQRCLSNGITVRDQADGAAEDNGVMDPFRSR